MTSGVLRMAVQHAHLVEALEECAPPVTAPYLEAAYRRMKTGYRVRQVDADIFALEIPFIGADGADWLQRMHFREHQIQSEYFSACNYSLSKSARSPCAEASALDAAAELSPSSAASFPDPEPSLPADRHSGSATSVDASRSTAFSSQARP